MLQQYHIIFYKPLSKLLKGIPVEHQERIIEKIEFLRNGLSGDVKKLTNQEEYRLRVGNYRVLFIVEETTITILSIKHRQGVY